MGFNGVIFDLIAKEFNSRVIITTEKYDGKNGYGYLNRLIPEMPAFLHIIQASSETNSISDGYQTFGELYEHRIANFIALCRNLKAGNNNKSRHIWRSKKHSDGELAFGGEWFVLGINFVPGEQITYHLPIADWNKTDFAEELPTAPAWDGHTSDDVLKRLAKL